LGVVSVLKWVSKSEKKILFKSPGFKRLVFFFPYIGPDLVGQKLALTTIVALSLTALSVSIYLSLYSIFEYLSPPSIDSRGEEAGQRAALATLLSPCLGTPDSC
jgi:hypothetical protein